MLISSATLTYLQIIFDGVLFSTPPGSMDKKSLQVAGYVEKHTTR